MTAAGKVERLEFGEVTVLVRFLERQVPVTLAFIPDRNDFEWSNPPEVNFVDRHVFRKLKDLRLNPPACAVITPLFGVRIWICSDSFRRRKPWRRL